MEKVIELKDQKEALALFGNFDKHLKYLQKNLNLHIIARNNTLKLEGDQGEMEKVENLFAFLLKKVRGEQAITLDTIQDKMVQLGLLSDQSESFQLTSNIPGFKPYSAGQKKYIQAIKNGDLTFSIGPAGTGKTYIAVVMAASAVRKGLVQRIVLVRPAVEAGEKLGFLPGDLQEKVNPYLRPLYDALNDILGSAKVKKYLEREVIEVVPLAYMRGRTLNRSFVILDEAQNTTSGQMKMFLTRMGEGSKIVVTGDVSQVDIPDRSKSGLITAREILRDVPGISFIELDHKDIVRHPLIERIVKAYEAYE